MYVFTPEEKKHSKANNNDDPLPLNIDNNVAQEYVNLGGDNGIIKVSDTSEDIGKTVIYFAKDSAAMIINGDIYTWGNNANQVLGLGVNTYSGKTSDGDYPVATSLVGPKSSIAPQAPIAVSIVISVGVAMVHLYYVVLFYVFCRQQTKVVFKTFCKI
mgnify:CR=1 FL=1